MTDSADAAGLIVLLTGQRAGSNHFLSLLQGAPEMVVLSEVFNPRAVYGIGALPEAEPLAERHGGMLGLHRAFRLHPEAALLDLRRAVGPGRKVVIKVCPAQVHGNALRRILSEQADAAVMLTRRRIDQYVSLGKAMETDRWHGLDTTELRPHVDLEPFLGWAAQLDRWLAEVGALCTVTRTPLARVDYDRDLDQPDRERLVTGLAERLAVLDLPCGTLNASGDSPFRRQDATRESFARIANGAALRAELAALNLLDYALASQAADRI